jgi:hypothetical protein
MKINEYLRMIISSTFKIDDVFHIKITENKFQSLKINCQNNFK